MDGANRIQSRIVAELLGLMLLCHFHAGAQVSPGVTNKEGFFHKAGDSMKLWVSKPIAPKPLKWKAYAIPTTLITYGTLSVASHWFDDVNLLGRRWASDNEDPNRKTSVDDYTEYVPALAVYGLNIAGVRGKHNIVDASMIYAMSQGISHLITIPAKRFTAENRPDSSDQLSFPSGHTSTAFVSAEFLRQEYKDVSPWIGAGGYAVAILTGYLRMYNNKHWLSDVIAGAGIGILSTRASYWFYPKLKNAILGKSASFSSTMLVPTWQRGGTFGICMVHGFR